MSDQFSMRIENADEVIFALKQLGLDASAVLEAAVQAGVSEIRASCKGRAGAKPRKPAAKRKPRASR